MSKLLMLSGLPASGKSTYAEELVKNSGGNWVRVNKDLIRTMLHADKFTYSNEKITQSIELEMASFLLKSGKSVVVDDTNLGEQHEKMWKDLANSRMATFSKRKFKTSFEECLRRNANRGYKVPQSAIHRMATQYKLIDGHWKDVVICDLDGTIADLSHRLPFINDEVLSGKHKELFEFAKKHGEKGRTDTEIRYSLFYANAQVENDPPIKEVIDKVRKEHEAGRTIIFVSGRSDVCRKGTEKFLREHVDFPWSALLMRASDDRRPDTMVKEDFLKKQLKDYNIVRVYDDRPSVIRMWQENGLEVVDCGDGIEF